MEANTGIMKIIGKYKDYYDYLQGVWGQDPKAVYARDSVKLFTEEDRPVFLGMTLSGLRRLTHKKLIPYYKPNGKNMYFDVKELIAWQKKNHYEPTGGQD